jgi:hypothetical protein
MRRALAPSSVQQRMKDSGGVSAVLGNAGGGGGRSGGTSTSKSSEAEGEIVIARMALFDFLAVPQADLNKQVHCFTARFCCGFKLHSFTQQNHPLALDVMM